MAISLKFTKMHALGNDFVIIDGVTQNIALSSSQIRKLSNRHTGIGFDQLLILTPPKKPEWAFHCRIFNADGLEVEQCGNGLRCVGRFAKESGLIKSHSFYVSLKESLTHIELLADGLVKVDLGRSLSQFNQSITVELDGLIRQAYFIHLGNPHCILFNNNIYEFELSLWGAALQTHPMFPNGVNVSVVNCLARNHIEMRVYERGVGETQACGSAACAAVIAGHLDNQLGNEAQVDLPGGLLSVKWRQSDEHIILTGPVKSVYQGHCVLSYNG